MLTEFPLSEIHTPNPKLPYFSEIFSKVFLNIFLMWVFFHKHSRFTGQQGKGEAISLSPLYHVRSLHRHLDISRAITAGSSPLHIACSQTRTGNF